MRAISTFFFICLTFFLCGQCDYTTPRYEVSEELEVYYGSGTLFNGQDKDLYMNIYKPIDDGNDKRPVAIFCFGGGFYTGNKSSFINVCKEYASRGFVAATIDYRLGFVKPTGLAYPFAYDNKEIPRAGYRAMQDAKSAIRFLKGRSVQDSSDIDNFFVGGGSAGGVTALAATFIDLPEDISEDVIGDLGKTNSNPAIERPALGSLEGDGNLNGYTADVRGVVNIFGALFDTLPIQEDDEHAIFYYHQTGDPIVPCGHRKAYWGIPFVHENMPLAFGSCVIEERLASIGHPENLSAGIIHNGNAHDIHDLPLVISESTAFIESVICETTTNLENEHITTMSLYPNPVEDIFYIDGDIIRGSIADVTGKQISQFYEAEVGVNDLSPGWYIARIYDKSGHLESIPFVKK